MPNAFSLSGLYGAVFHAMIMVMSKDKLNFDEDDDMDRYFQAERAANIIVTASLEEKYSSRSLKFTQPIGGSVPVQAFGHLDDLRFYFRFRGNWGSLRVGPYDREIEELWAQRVNEDHAARRERALKAKAVREAQGEDGGVDDIFDEFFMGIKEVAVPEDSPSFYPHKIAKYSSAEGANPEDIYNGSLTADEAFDMFSKLVDALHDIDEKDQLDEGTRIWLYEGRTKAGAYQEKRMRTLSMEE